MGKMNIAQNIHIVPIRATTDDSATFAAPHINMKLYEKVEFLVYVGNITGDTMTMTATQSAVTAGSTSTAIAARYRITAAAGTDTMGATTALATTGLALTNGTHDLLTIIVDIDSQDMTTESKPYAGLTFTKSSSGQATTTIFALCWPKYPQETNASALT
ncbi:MAG: hypothetical protein PHI12_08820 [Dehalococcoidales bacterium]|nr:hypothetical protein [Dehalococcoidales bacterium]